VTAWLVCAAIAAVLGFVVWGLARASSHEMPPYADRRRGGYEAPEPSTPGLPEISAETNAPGQGDLGFMVYPPALVPVRGGYVPEWQPDPSRFGRCPSCGTLRPLDDGLIADHDRPEPQVPFNVQSFPCRGAGQAPMQPMETER
jgi:hypothetical protein